MVRWVRRLFPVSGERSGRRIYVRRSTVPYRPLAWHSKKADGYYDDGIRKYPCYHDCLNCPHLRGIFRRGNQIQGRGWDQFRQRVRRICGDCRDLRKQGDCVTY